MKESLEDTLMGFSIQSIYDWYRQSIRNPKYRWWIIGATLAYLFSPIDLIPDIFPIAGQIDDAVVATLLIAELSQLFMARFKAQQDDSLTDEPASSVKNAKRDDTVDVNAVSVK